MDTIALARVIHVLAVIVWIGGMSMATSVILPAVRRGELGSDQAGSFHAVERRFIWQARVAVLLVGLSGFYMVAALDLWGRFSEASFWWMHAMVALWSLFMFILFVAEPFLLHRKFARWSEQAPAQSWAWLHRSHWVFLSLSALTVIGAVAGSHGWPIF